MEEPSCWSVPPLIDRLRTPGRSGRAKAVSTLRSATAVQRGAGRTGGARLPPSCRVPPSSRPLGVGIGIGIDLPPPHPSSPSSGAPRSWEAGRRDEGGDTVLLSVSPCPCERLRRGRLRMGLTRSHGDTEGRPGAGRSGVEAPGDRGLASAATGGSRRIWTAAERGLSRPWGGQRRLAGRRIVEGGRDGRPGAGRDGRGRPPVAHRCSPRAPPRPRCR